VEIGKPSFNGWARLFSFVSIVEVFPFDLWPVAEYNQHHR